MIKFLGVLDILSGIILILLFYFQLSFGWIFAGYILIKSIVFFSVVSVVDIIVAIIFILAMFNIHNIFTIIGAVWMIQKGIFSLF